MNYKSIYLLALFVFSWLFNSCSKTDRDDALATPIITLIQPTSGGVGTLLKIAGSNFNQAASKNIVTINNVQATIQSASDTMLTVMVPVTSSGPVSVANQSTSVNGPTFNYTPSAIVAGLQHNTSGGYTAAVYWINGKLTELTNGNSNAAAKAIATLNGDLYFAGFEYYGRFRVAKVWKNGIATPLAAEGTDADATCIAVSGTDIYVAGFLNNGVKNVATVWKNGQATALTNGVNNASATSIAVNGNDVFIAGYENVGNKNIAMYWKNGVATALTNGVYDASANGIAISGNDVFITGYETNLPYGGQETGLYWKNGVASRLVAGPHTTSGYAIAVAAGNVHIVGNIFNVNQSIRQGARWENGVFSYASAGPSENITSVAVAGNDVYMAGHAYANTNIAKYWKNDSMVVLTGPSKNASPTAIIVR